MTINTPGIYHIYNRGNNQQTIFFSDENYFYFLRKCHQYLNPFSSILAWCLMPNHFHFLINVNDESLKPVKSGGIVMPAITNGFRLLQSSYAKGLNKQLNRTGNLFQQKTKAKWTNDAKDYSIITFHYIHQNPVAAGLVKKPEEWTYSSFNDYAGLRNGTLCNKQKAYELLNLTGIDFYIETMKKIEEELITKIL
jgi:putative transposase